MTNTTQGFTLIELLIVIAIIGILAAVLLPNLLGAQKRAYDTAALGCANALAKAVATYRVDNPTTSDVKTDDTYYKDDTANNEYGAGSKATKTGCGNPDLTVTGTGSTSTDYQFVISHAQGRNQYTLTQSGIVTAKKAAATGTN